MNGTKWILRLLGMALLVFIFVGVACSGGENAPAATPTPTPDPVQQREELLKQLAGLEKDSYATSNLMFELRGKSAYDKLQALADSYTKAMVVQFLDKDGNIISGTILFGFVDGDEIKFPLPWSFIRDPEFNPNESTTFQVVVYPEQAMLSFEEGNYVFNEDYSLIIVKLPKGLNVGSMLRKDILPRGEIANLKPLDFVYIQSTFGFVPGQVVTEQESGAEGFGIVSHIRGVDAGGGLVIALKKDGASVVVGVVGARMSEDADEYGVLGIDVLLAQRITPQQ